MRKIFGLLFAFSIILGITFLSEAISPNNPFSVKAQGGIEGGRTTKGKPGLKQTAPRKRINYAKGTWTWKKNSHRTIIIHGKRAWTWKKARSNRKFPALKPRKN